MAASNTLTTVGDGSSGGSQIAFKVPRLSRGYIVQLEGSGTNIPAANATANVRFQPFGGQCTANADATLGQPLVAGVPLSVLLERPLLNELCVQACTDTNGVVLTVSCIPQNLT
jgi:hypothetical protein